MSAAHKPRCVLVKICCRRCHSSAAPSCTRLQCVGAESTLHSVTAHLASLDIRAADEAQRCSAYIRRHIARPGVLGRHAAVRGHQRLQSKRGFCQGCRSRALCHRSRCRPCQRAGPLPASRAGGGIGAIEIPRTFTCRRKDNL